MLHEYHELGELDKALLRALRPVLLGYHHRQRVEFRAAILFTPVIDSVISAMQNYKYYLLYD